MKQNNDTVKAPGKNYNWIFVLALFGMIPLLKKCISDYRYNTEIRPIRDGLIERFKRNEAVVLGDTGRIYALTPTDTLKTGYQWYNGFRSGPNDSMQFRIGVRTTEGNVFFSRDTTVGQVVCILIDTKNDSSTNISIFGIYFKDGTAEPLYNNMNLRRAVLYLGDPGYTGCFIADTFDRDSLSAQGILARQRLQVIREELVKRKIDSFFIKTY